MTAAVDIVKPKAGKQVSPFNWLKTMYEYAVRSFAGPNFFKGMFKFLSVYL